MAVLLDTKRYADSAVHPALPAWYRSAPRVMLGFQVLCAWWRRITR
jgi:hypothetical protein